MSHLQNQFDAFHRDNPNVWELFESFSLKAFNRGLGHYSADAILHQIRWHTNVETKGAGEVEGEELKINNNYAAYYARMFIAKHSTAKDFFRTRRVAGDPAVVGAVPRHDQVVNA